MLEKFKAVGISHQTSTLAQRERLSLNDSESREFLRVLNDTLGLDELLIISTCNRTEVYYSSAVDKSSEIISLLAINRGLEKTEVLSSFFKSIENAEAVQHLYEVALGLDAKVLGDIQISNQVKRAYQASADESLAGPFLHRLMHSIFFANKRVVQETAFRDGAASTAYASVDLTNHFISNFKAPKILVLGLGEIGQDVAGNLSSVTADITLANRTISKSEELAEQYGFKSLSLAEALDQVNRFDVIISSVAVSEPLVTATSFDLTKINLKLLIDLSVPRSIDHTIEQIPGVLLYNIDQLEEKTSEIISTRESSIPTVRQIMSESISELSEWSQEMEVSPTIRKFKQALDDIRVDEISKYLKNADQEQIDLVDKVTKRMMRKVIKLPVLQLKAACKRGDAENLVEVLSELFDLEQESKSSSSSK
jgi:glutamyl-tRNA reductase